MKNLLLVVLLFLNGVLSAQTKKSYQEHKVAPKESFYSIGRKYNIPPKELAEFNNLDYEKGLSIGQVIRIPVAGKTTSSIEKQVKNATSTPQNHTVLKGETLYQIAKKYKLTVAELKQMNNLVKDNIEPGDLLVVGYAKGQTKPSDVKTVQQTTKAETIETKPDAVAELPAVEKPAKTETPKNVVVENPVKEVAVKNTENKPGNSNSTPPAQKKAEPVELVFPNGEIPAEGAFSVLYTPSAARATNATYFNKVGDVATFKSTSGWQDRKYYALINDVEPGTILKITSLENKVIYAKVLGNMPEMKENKGLLLRLSNSAASALGIIDPKFTVQVSFYAIGE